MDEAREIGGAVLVALVLALVVAAVGKCDYVILFTGYNCPPCEATKPHAYALKNEGYDIRVVNAKEQPALASYYRIYRWPQAVYVCEIGTGDYDSGLRIVGQCSKEKLRSLCEFPGFTSVRDCIGDSISAFGRWIGGR